MTLKLLVEALVKYLAGVVIVAAMLFLPAGTWDYWQGWLLMAILFVPISIVGVVLMSRRPELLRKRLRTKESDSK